MSRTAARTTGLSAAVLTVLACVAIADEGAGSAAQGSPPEPKRDNVWFAFPIVFSLPETSVAYGATGGVHLLRPGLKTSSIQPTAYTTLKHQSYGEVVVQYYDSASTAVSAAVRAARFPSEFFGIGPLAAERDKESFTTDYVEVVFAREWEVASGLRIGPKLHARDESLAHLQAVGALASSGVASSDTYRAAGLGPNLTFDDRDDLFWPTSGSLVQAWGLAYAEDRGRAFMRTSVEAARFVPLGHGHVLGLDVRAEAAAGDVPFTLLPKIGGPLELRGYYEGRWRDRLHGSAQAEWRFPIAGRFRGTAFAGVAAVAHSFDQLDAARPRPAGGCGIRYQITSTGLNLRADVAVGKDGPLMYVTLGEAF